MAKSTKKTGTIRAKVKKGGMAAAVGSHAGRRTRAKSMLANGREHATPRGDFAREHAPPREVLAYNATQSPADKQICDKLADSIARHLKEMKAEGVENKIWHRHPVWFLDGNPIVGYHKLKDCVRLLFWSGQSFGEPGLAAEGSFKAAEARYTAVDQVSASELKRWIAKAIAIQWDYKNIVKRKGRLERLK